MRLSTIHESTASELKRWLQLAAEKGYHCVVGHYCNDPGRVYRTICALTTKKPSWGRFHGAWFDHYDILLSNMVNHAVTKKAASFAPFFSPNPIQNCERCKAETNLACNCGAVCLDCYNRAEHAAETDPADLFDMDPHDHHGPELEGRICPTCHSTIYYAQSAPREVSPNKMAAMLYAEADPDEALRTVRQLIDGP